jgi:hypothetical protein
VQRQSLPYRELIISLAVCLLTTVISVDTRGHAPLDLELTCDGAPLTWTRGFSPATCGVRGAEAPPPQQSAQMNPGLAVDGAPLTWRRGFSPATRGTRGPEGPPPQLPTPALVDNRSLPDTATFIAEVKARVRTDRELQAQYTFLERREEIEVTKLGKVKKGAVKEYEVYPSVVPGNTYKRLVKVDGKPLDPALLEKNDEKHRRDVLNEANQSPADRAKRGREQAKQHAEERRLIDEIFALYEITLVGRDMVGAYPTIVAVLEPRPGYSPKMDDARLLKKFRVRAFVHESEYQVVKIEAEAIEDVTFGWGVLGRLHKGAITTFERRKVNDEVWLPARVHIKGTGRAVIFRRFALDSVTEWFDYKKFAVKTDETYGERH